MRITTSKESENLYIAKATGKWSHLYGTGSTRAAAIRDLKSEIANLSDDARDLEPRNSEHRSLR